MLLTVRSLIFALIVVSSLLLTACGGGDGDISVPTATSDTSAHDAVDTKSDEEAASATPVPAEPKTRSIGLTAYLEGFEVEVRSATFSPRVIGDGAPIATIIEIDTKVANLVDQNRRGPTYAFIEAGGERFPPLLQPQFIAALSSDDVVYRFELEPGIGPDDTVLWFVQRDRGNAVALPLGDVGPTYTLAPIEFEFATPEPVGGIVFEGSSGRVEFYGDGHRQLTGYAFVVIDLAATNTGSDRAGIARYSVQVDGVGTTPGGDHLRAGRLVLAPGESTDAAIRAFQIPLYGQRITVLAERDVNADPFVFLEFEVPGLGDAIPDENRPTPPG